MTKASPPQENEDGTNIDADGDQHPNVTMLDDTFDLTSGNSVGSVHTTTSTAGARHHSPIRQHHHHRFRSLSCITYEQTTWFIYIAFTLLAIIDRFTWNVWPRQTYSIGAGPAGTDRYELKPGPWAVKAYDVIARISGRFAICCFNLLLVTRLKSLEYFLSNSSWINHHLLNCSDITNANIRLHRWNAIALCILTVIHVWSILFPCVFHGYQAQVVPGNFEYPLSERGPKGFKDVNVETETMGLQVDDVWRMIEMTLMLGILMPFSVRWLARRWHVGMPLHQFIMVMYFVDIVRRHSHPHSWILNTPFFSMWILDKIFQQYWKRCIKPSVHRIKLDDKYMILLWNISDTNTTKKTCSTTSTTVPSDMLGPDYYLRLNDSSLFESRHDFTAFENRLGLRLEDVDSNKTSGGNSSNSSCTSNNSNILKKQGAASLTTWSAATVIRVFDNKRVPRLGDKDPISHTQRIFQTDQLDLSIWGPVPGEMSNHIRYALTALPAAGTSSSPVVLVGAGSGVAYMLDALQYYYQNVSTEQSSLSASLSTGKRHFNFKIIFTTRSVSLFRWMEQMVCKIVHHSECIGDENIPIGKTAKIVLALTDAAGKADDSSSHLDLEESIIEINPRMTLIQQFGRIDFEDEIPTGSTVFYQGGLALKSSVKKTCRVKQAHFFSGRGGG